MISAEWFRIVTWIDFPGNPVTRTCIFAELILNDTALGINIFLGREGTPYPEVRILEIRHREWKQFRVTRHKP